MGLFKSISGMIEMELTSADIPQTMENITRIGVRIFDLHIISELTVVFQIKQMDYEIIQRYAEKTGISLKVRKKWGLYWTVKAMLKRPVLLAGLCILFAVCWFVPGRVFFIEVQGNDAVPELQILEAAADCGIRFGVSGREVRSEKMKNALLSQVPQLQWAGINTYGSRAVITVRERTQEEEITYKRGVSSIVAIRDGIIISSTVSAGNQLVIPGQAVRAGQTLISGYTDCGLSIEATEAQGDIFALTRRSLNVLSPGIQHVRGEMSGTISKFSLQIGKKRINLYKGSGIFDASCVKMYSKYVLTLPGGFSLPVVLIRETVAAYQTEEADADEERARAQMILFAEQYLRSRMIAGIIIQRQEVFSSDDGFSMTGQYECQEMIGRVKPEQIGVYNGKTD